MNSNLPAYGAQSEPLRRPKRKPRMVPILWAWILIVTACSAGILACIQTYRVEALNHRLAEYPPTRAELDELKQEWGLELTAHKQMQDYDKWAEDRLAFERERDEWLVARREYRVDQESWDRQRQLYEEATENWRRAKQDYERIKKFWAHEKEGWEREQKAWELERKHWAQEQERRNVTWKEDADHFRLSEGNMLGLSWTHVESHQCVAHGTREYTARLAFDAEKACELPIAVDGAVFRTAQECKMDGDSLVSRWYIDRGEASCKTYWSGLVDKGCTGQGSGKHRFEARLLGLSGPKERWMTMCSTTPIDIRGQHFNRPTHCEGRTVYPMIGIWDVDDEHCS